MRVRLTCETHGASMQPTWVHLDAPNAIDLLAGMRDGHRKFRECQDVLRIEVLS